ncbi:MAG: hypothetical protein QM783_00160 [Phycisphaerales bacterium]
MRTRYMLIPVSAALLLGACGGQAPQLKIDEAYIAERTETGAVAHLVVTAHNPTLDPLPMRAMAYSTGGAGLSHGEVERWAQATAPPGGAVTFEIPVAVVPNGSPTLSVSGKVAYVPNGKIRELLGEIDVPLPTASFSGTVPIDWNAPLRPAPTLRPGTARTALVTDRGPIKAADPLPPLPEAK